MDRHAGLREVRSVTAPGLMIFCAVCAALGNIAGGALVTTRFQPSQRLLTYLVAFGGGFMLAAALIRMVPESMSITDGSAAVAPALFLVGYMVVHFFEHVLGEHFHLGPEPHDPAHAHQAMSASTLFGLCVHALFDGVAIGSGFAVNPTLGMLLFFAILLHKIPEGSTIASVMLHSGQGPRRAMLAAMVLAIATVTGAIITAQAVEETLKYALPIATGVTIHVAASDLIPEVNELRGFRMAITVMAGAAAFWLSDVALAMFGIK